ncbi:MAG: acireductone synthase [Alcanivoracaceae bacterium]|nr:acireductone synthase [Alcanivoracaceae bacterium]
MARVVLTDIEGTTSSISFVKDVLFPYAANHMLAFLQKNWNEPTIQHEVSEIIAEAGTNISTPEQANELLQQWIREDKKITPLKSLQGMIWKSGYQSGAYQAHVYPDVPHQLADWKKSGIDLFVYSSGSIAAQKLFFGFSDAGDLTPLFSDYFDTTIGGKRDAESYARIAKKIGVSANEILFLSDIVEELDAAKQSGMQTMLLDRQHQAAPSTHNVVDSFSDIYPHKS